MATTPQTGTSSLTPQDARRQYVKDAAAAIRGKSDVGILTTGTQHPIAEISDVIYLADYIERGPASYWLTDTTKES